MRLHLFSSPFSSHTPPNMCWESIHLVWCLENSRRFRRPREAQSSQAVNCEAALTLQNVVLDFWTCGGVLSEEMGCICMDKFIQVRAFPLITRITVFELAERALPGACSHSMGLCVCFCVYVRVRVCVAAGCWPCCMWQSTSALPAPSARQLSVRACWKWRTCRLTCTGKSSQTVKH